MPELGQSTMRGGKKAKPGPNCLLVERTPADTRVAGEGPARSRRLPHRKSARTRQPVDVLAGLPAHVMDELVEDLAEAVVAILLSQGTTEPDEDEHASGDLR